MLKDDVNIFLCNETPTEITRLTGSNSCIYMPAYIDLQYYGRDNMNVGESLSITHYVNKFKVNNVVSCVGHTEYNNIDSNRIDFFREFKTQ